jgi:hypothetical protein
MRLASQLDCRSSETSSILVRGAKVPSSPWWATGFQVRRTAFDSLARCHRGCAEDCALALQASSLGALPSISTVIVRARDVNGSMPVFQTGRLGSFPSARTSTSPRMLGTWRNSVRFSRGARLTTSSTGVRHALQTRDGAVRFRCSSPSFRCWTAPRLLSASGEDRHLSGALTSDSSSG